MIGQKGKGQQSMRKEIARFSGMFQLWQYTVGHGRLLYRRTKGTETETRIDILFKPVYGMQLATVLHDPVIYLTDPSELPADFLGLSPAPSDANTYFIQAQKFKGYIVASYAGWHEDAGEWDEPSYWTLPWMGPETRSGESEGTAEGAP